MSNLGILFNFASSLFPTLGATTLGIAVHQWHKPDKGFGTFVECLGRGHNPIAIVGKTAGYWLKSAPYILVAGTAFNLFLYRLATWNDSRSSSAPPLDTLLKRGLLGPLAHWFGLAVTHFLVDSGQSSKPKNVYYLSLGAMWALGMVVREVDERQ